MKYEILMYWGKRELSFLNGAKCIIDFLEDLALFDSRFSELSYIALKNEKNQIMKFGEKAIEVDFLATKIFDEQIYWLKKRYPIDIHGITSAKHFGITPIFTTSPSSTEKIVFQFGLGISDDARKNSVIVDFPDGMEQDIEWFCQIINRIIKTFSPDYGGLYPRFLLHLDTPKVCPGWVTYFAPHIALPPDAFEGCTALPLPNGQMMHAIENNHMVAKDEVQFQKLKALVEKFRAYDLKL
jgi:hypothetical protein